MRTNVGIPKNHQPNSGLFGSFSHHLTHLLHPLRQWLDHLEIRDRNVAHRLAKLIPAQCPFERDVFWFGRFVGHIPPLCKLNPLYDQFAGLRFRALCCLAEQWGEDISNYC